MEGILAPTNYRDGIACQVAALRAARWRVSGRVLLRSRQATAAATTLANTLLLDAPRRARPRAFSIASAPHEGPRSGACIFFGREPATLELN